MVLYIFHNTQLDLRKLQEHPTFLSDANNRDTEHVIILVIVV